MEKLITQLTTSYCFTLNKQIMALDAGAYKRLAFACGWSNIRQLETYLGSGNEIASLLVLLERKQGTDGLSSFYKGLSIIDLPQYEHVQECISNGPCKELFIN